jgi:hypothetical protein
MNQCKSQPYSIDLVRQARMPKKAPPSTVESS